MTSTLNTEQGGGDLQFLTLLTELTNVAYDCGAFVFEYGTEEEQKNYNKLLEKFNGLNGAVIEAYRKKGESDATERQP